MNDGRPLEALFQDCADDDLLAQVMRRMLRGEAVAERADPLLVDERLELDCIVRVEPEEAAAIERVLERAAS